MTHPLVKDIHSKSFNVRDRRSLFTTFCEENQVFFELDWGFGYSGKYLVREDCFCRYQVILTVPDTDETTHYMRNEYERLLVDNKAWAILLHEFGHVHHNHQSYHEQESETGRYDRLASDNKIVFQEQQAWDYALRTDPNLFLIPEIRAYANECLKSYIDNTRD